MPARTAGTNVSAAALDNFLKPAERVPASIQDSPPTRTDMANRFMKTNVVTANPQLRQAIAAITMHYQHLDPLMGDIQILGDKIYISADGWQKEFHASIPIVCRRWIKRLCTAEETELHGLEPWRKTYRQGEGQGDGYVGHGSRLWHIELQIRAWKEQQVAELAGGACFVRAVPDGEWFTISTAYGEASDLNCDLTIAAGGRKLKGDARVLDRMAIKRGEHELIRECLSLTLRGARSLDQVQLLGEGLRIASDDGISGMDDENLPVRPAGGGYAPDVPAHSANRELMDYAMKCGIPVRDREAAVQEALASSEPYVVLEQWTDKGETTGPADKQSDAQPVTESRPEPALEPAAARTTRTRTKPGGRRATTPAAQPEAQESLPLDPPVDPAEHFEPGPDVNGVGSEAESY
jgi:hypothetical protein